MNCQEVERTIVMGEGLNGEAGLHLLSCASCQRFAHAHELLLAGGEPVPGEALDSSVKAAWRATGMSSRIWFARRVLMPVAAALLLLLGVWTLWGPSSKEAGSVAETADVAAMTEDAWGLGWDSAEQELLDLELGLAFWEMDKALSGKQLTVDSLSYDMLSLEFGLDEM